MATLRNFYLEFSLTAINDTVEWELGL